MTAVVLGGVGCLDQDIVFRLTWTGSMGTLKNKMPAVLFIRRLSQNLPVRPGHSLAKSVGHLTVVWHFVFIFFYGGITHRLPLQFINNVCLLGEAFYLTRKLLI